MWPWRNYSTVFTPELKSHKHEARMQQARRRGREAAEPRHCPGRTNQPGRRLQPQQRPPGVHTRACGLPPDPGRPYHPARAWAPLAAHPSLSVGRKPQAAGLRPRPQPGGGRYLAVSECEVTGASQCRKGTLCSWMCMSYRPWGVGGRASRRAAVGRGPRYTVPTTEGGIPGALSLPLREGFQVHCLHQREGSRARCPHH